MIKFLKNHFKKYQEIKDPWEFCWKIAIEGVVVGLVAAVIMELVGVPDRVINMSTEEFLILAILIAPIIETLLFQAFPIWICRLCGARLQTQIWISTVVFCLVHMPDGVGTAIGAGVLGGIYFGFTYAHWRNSSRWQAYWVTAVSHGIHNLIVCIVALMLGEL